MWYSEACKKDKKINTKHSYNKSKSCIENEVISRINNKVADETCTYLIPEFDQVDGLGKKTIDDCTQLFHRLKYKRVSVVNFIHETEGTTSITKEFKNQDEEITEANELSNQIDECLGGENGYQFHSNRKLMTEMFT